MHPNFVAGFEQLVGAIVNYHCIDPAEPMLT